LSRATYPVDAAAAAFAGLLLLAAAMGIGRFAYTPLLPPLREALGWSVAQAGDVASANYLGYLVGALAASALAARHDRRALLLAAMGLSAATTAAGAWTATYPAWLAIRFLAGGASAFCMVLGTAIVVEVLAARGRPDLGALHFAGVGAGIVISVAVIALAQAAGASVFGAWAALGLASGVLVGGTGIVLRHLPGARRAETAARAAAPVVHPGLLARVTAAYGLFGFGYVVTATFIVAMARGLEDARFVEPVVWLVVGLLAASSVAVWQWLSQRFGLYPALRAAYAVAAAGVLLAGFGSGKAALLAGGAMLGFTFVAVTGMGLVAARQAAGESHPRAFGWITASFGLGQLLGPAVGGRLTEATGGFGAASLAAAALLVLGIGLLWGVERR
jgi:predicted MFS family arabinose efflux permease